MSKTYSAGIVTAYGAAKRAGYQGTYEDFCRQQAGYAESAAAVEQAKTTAVNAAATATTKAGEATTAATEARTAKTQTEQSASQALTDIAAARSGAISAVQAEGATQTANATAQAQAASQSATTASTKASEASASATSAGQSATNAAASAASAAQSASNAQDVLDSIPADYSDLSANVSQLQADLTNQTGLYHWNEKGLIDLSGSSVNLTPKTNYGIDCAVIDCSAGDKFIITGTGGNKSRVWGFIDGNNAILTVSDADATVENFEITAPTNAVKLILNAYRNSDIYAYKVGNNLATKASNGLSDEVKEAILNCFRNVAWLNGTDGEVSFEALLEVFGMSDFYNTWEWSYPGNLNMYKGTPSFLNGSSTDGVLLNNSQIYAKNKRTVFVNKGKLAVVEDVAVSGDLFPIPIPPGATLVRASINPSNMQVLLQRWRLQGDVYKLDGISSWQTGTATLSFSSAHDTFICVNIRYDSSQSVFPTEPQGFEITFE